MWYGWIPVLSPVLIEPNSNFTHFSDGGQLRTFGAFGGLRSHNLGINDLNTQDREMLVEACRYLVCSPTGASSKVRTTLERWNDIDPTEEVEVKAYFKVGDGHLVTPVGVMFLAKNGGADGSLESRLLSLSLINKLDIRNGMVAYEIHLPRTQSNIHGGAIRQKIHAKHHYKYIRDIYHVHMWTNGDFGVLPVEAPDEDRAAREIWKRYFAKDIFHYHHNDIFAAIRSTDGISLRKDWLLITKLCSKAKGEVIYSRALAEMVLPEEERYINAASRGMESFENLTSHANSLFEQKNARQTFTFNILLMFLALIGTWAALNSVLDSTDYPNHASVSFITASLLTGFAMVMQWWSSRGIKKDDCEQ